jgi:tetratricopeptide (TPR) repeat protein
MPDRKSRPEKKPHDSFLFAFIFCATLLAYFPALRGEMLWDDSAHITRPDLQTLHGLWRIWTVPGATQQYYPLLHSAFWIEHAIWGSDVVFYHLLNVALHALSACLLIGIVRRLGMPGAWLAGLLFAMHPVSVEAVAWISEQKSTLSGVFYFAAALSYLSFDETRKRATWWAAFGLFLAALLAKTVTAVLPGVLLVLLWRQRARIEWRRDLRPLLPFFAAGAAAGLCTVWVERALIGASGAEFALAATQRIALAGRVIWFYAGKTLWPVNLAFFYPRWKLDDPAWRQYGFSAGFAAVAALLYFVARRRAHRGPLASLLIFAGTLFPVLGFFNVYPFRYSYVADHFAYLAGAAILAPVAAVVALASQKYLPQGVRFLPGTILAVALGAMTWRQAGNYRNEETLYRATLEQNPGAWLAHNNLANLLLASGRRTEALSHLKTALELNPDFSEAHVSMGNALIESGQPGAAIAEYQQAIRLAPESERAHANLGNALLQSGRMGEAIAELEIALRIDAGNAEARNGLANAFSQIPGRLPDAIAQYRVALADHPNFAEAHNGLGRALAQLPGEMPDAIAEFQAAIHLKPDYAGAHSNLGSALSLMPGRLADAITEYRAALRLRPDFPAAHNNLGFALSHSSETLPEAVAEYREAIRLAPDFADAHYNLAVALLQLAGRRQEALAEFEIVHRLKPGFNVREIVGSLPAGK